MKSPRTQRAWRAWLSLPQGLRPGIVMAAAIVLVALVGSCLPAHAVTLITRSGGDYIRITTDVCTADLVLANVPERYRNVVRDGVSFYQGREWHICWFVDGDFAHLLYEDGDEGMLPLSDFKPRPFT